MVAAFERLADALANDERAGAQMLAQDAKAADLRVGRQFAENARDGGALAKNIPAFARHNCDLEIPVNDGPIVRQREAAERRVGRLDARVEHRDSDALAPAALQEGARFLNCWPRVHFQSLVHPTARLNRRNSINCDSRAAASWTLARCCGRNPGGSATPAAGRRNCTQETTPRQAFRK